MRCRRVPARRVTRPLAASADTSPCRSSSSSRTPGATAMPVKLCPAPTAFTLRPCLTAAITARCTLRGCADAPRARGAPRPNGPSSARSRRFSSQERLSLAAVGGKLLDDLLPRHQVIALDALRGLAALRMPEPDPVPHAQRRGGGALQTASAPHRRPRARVCGVPRATPDGADGRLRAGPEAIHPPPSTVAMSAAGRRTTSNAKAEAGAGRTSGSRRTGGHRAARSGTRLGE